MIVDGKTFDCDVGRFNDDIFIYVAAFGLFTDVPYETKQDMKNILGHLAYVLEGAKRISGIPSYPMKIECDEEVVEGDFIFGMITNSLSVGGFRNITGKNVLLDDGAFEVTLIKRPKTPAELNSIGAALLNRNINAECMYCFKASRLKITSIVDVAWTLDGEFGGRHHEVIVENAEKALQIRVPMDRLDR